MDTNELLRKVRKIEIKTKGLSQNIFAGEYHSAFKGRGMTFSEVREYQYGDDVRDIDWNVTASKDFGAVGVAKREMMAEIGATIAFSAIQNNDKVGVIFFSDKVEKFIPPKKGRKHILLVIRELLDFQPTGTGTDINMVLEYMTGALKKRCTTFLVSDFIDEHDYSKSLSIANHKHDVIAVQVYDKREAQLPDVGLMRMRDAERGTMRWVNTSSKRVRDAYSRWWYNQQQAVNGTLQRCNVDMASVATDEDYVTALMGLFKSRGRV